MVIEAIDLHLVKCIPLTISRGSIPNSHNIVVRLTHEGISGHGEGAPISYCIPTINAESIRTELQSLVEPLGDVTPWESQRIDTITKSLGVSSSTRCALDEAVYDWLGCRLNVPVYRLLGGDQLQINKSSITIGIDSGESLKRRTEHILSKLNPSIIKLKLGSPRGIDADIDMCSSVLEVIPPGTRIHVDANAGWKSVSDALRIMHWLATAGVEFVEQPLHQDRADELAELFKHRPLPIYLDESCWTCKDVIDVSNYTDGVCLKLMKAGGLRETLRLVITARAFGLSIMLGCTSESSLSIAAAVALSPYVDFVDLDSHLNLQADPFSSCVNWQDGRVLPSQLPGFGIPHDLVLFS